MLKVRMTRTDISATRLGYTGEAEPVCPLRAVVYTDFFGFSELPFNNTPDPRFFYSTPGHEEALASLIYAVKARKGFVLLTGEIGAGKTLMTRMMIRHFGTRIAFANIHHVLQSPADLMESICTEFELPIERGEGTTRRVRLLHDFLLMQFSQNVPVVLVLDEAHNLPVDAFEQLRMIGNLEADDAKLLQIAIVGQPELQQLFLSRDLRQLRQRIFRIFHLSALSREATEGYIRHRLSVVTDDTQQIFENSAFEAIYRFSHGLPRLINTLCDNALLSAYSADRRLIDGPFTESVIAQMMVIGQPGGGRETPDGAHLGTRLINDAVSSLPTSPSREDPGPSADTAQMPQTGAVAERPAKNMAQRAGAIEPRVPPDRPAPAGTGLTAEQRAHIDALEAKLGEVAARQRKVHAETTDLTRHLAALERRVCTGTGDLAQAQTIHANLRRLVEEGRVIGRRIDSGLTDLARRDTQLRTLAGTIKNAVRDLSRLLDRAHEVTGNSTRTEATARATHDRLVAQTRRSRELADELAQLGNGMLSSRMVDTSDPQVVGERMPSTDPSCGRAAEGSTGRDGQDGVRQLLHGTRESLSGLRDLARLADHRDAAREHPPADLPTHRLAQQVESLLDMVGAGGS